MGYWKHALRNTENAIQKGVEGAERGLAMWNLGKGLYQAATTIGSAARYIQPLVTTLL